MSAETFTLQCAPGQAESLSGAVAAYAEAAYPPGGSECTQVARETLLNSAQLIARDAAGTGAILSRRQRSLYKAAVEWYFGDDVQADPEMKATLLALIP